MPVQTDFLGALTQNGPRTIAGDGRVSIIWSPTFRTRATAAEGTNTTNRTSGTVFLRGLKEKINFRTDTAVSWRWRRVIFFNKGLTARISGLNTAYKDDARGYTRALVDVSSAAATNIRNQLEALLFEGEAGKDWADLFSAKVDNSNITLYSDKTRILSSANDSGRFFKQNNWYPVNKNLVYVDDESGSTKAGNTAVSTTSKRGIGDMFIMDFFECSSGNSADHLIFSPEATLYWHEK